MHIIIYIKFRRNFKLFLCLWQKKKYFLFLDRLWLDKFVKSTYNYIIFSSLIDKDLQLNLSFGLWLFSVNNLRFQSLCVAQIGVRLTMDLTGLGEHFMFSEFHAYYMRGNYIISVAWSLSPGPHGTNSPTQNTKHSSEQRPTNESLI